MYFQSCIQGVQCLYYSWLLRIYENIGKNMLIQINLISAQSNFKTKTIITKKLEINNIISKLDILVFSFNFPHS